MKPLIVIPESALEFLKRLKKNNNRDWFNMHKQDFLREQHSIEIFADALLQQMSTHDHIETISGRQSLHRIYRDTRFSSDKTPYKSNWSGSFRRATKFRRGGYYFHIEPGNSFVAGSFWAPSAPDLKLIRDDISFDPAPLRKILKSKTLISTFGQLQGEQLKTVPRGFAATDEAIDLLRYKQFLLIRKFSDKEVLSSDFLIQAAKTFKNLRPFFDYMSMILSSDKNGIIT